MVDVSGFANVSLQLVWSVARKSILDASASSESLSKMHEMLLNDMERLQRGINTLLLKEMWASLDHLHSALSDAGARRPRGNAGVLPTGARQCTACVRRVSGPALADTGDKGVDDRLRLHPLGQRHGGQAPVLQVLNNPCTASMPRPIASRARPEVQVLDRHRSRQTAIRKASRSSRSGVPSNTPWASPTLRERS